MVLSVFGSKRQEGWRKLHDDVHHSLLSAGDKIKMSWVKHVAYMGREEMRV
jgi:hypothetical protein